MYYIEKKNFIKLCLYTHFLPEMICNLADWADIIKISE